MLESSALLLASPTLELTGVRAADGDLPLSRLGITDGRRLEGRRFQAVSLLGLIGLTGTIRPGPLMGASSSYYILSAGRQDRSR